MRPTSGVGGDAAEAVRPAALVAEHEVRRRTVSRAVVLHALDQLRDGPQPFLHLVDHVLRVEEAQALAVDDRRRPRAAHPSGCSRSPARARARRRRSGGAAARRARLRVLPQIVAELAAAVRMREGVHAVASLPANRSAASRAIRSAAWFTQPTVLRIHTSLRVPTRPFAASVAHERRSSAMATGTGRRTRRDSGTPAIADEPRAQIVRVHPVARARSARSRRRSGSRTSRRVAPARTRRARPCDPRAIGSRDDTVVPPTLSDRRPRAARPRRRRCPPGGCGRSRRGPPDGSLRAGRSIAGVVCTSRSVAIEAVRLLARS